MSESRWGDVCYTDDRPRGREVVLDFHDRLHGTFYVAGIPAGGFHVYSIRALCEECRREAEGLSAGPCDHKRRPKRYRTTE